MTKWENQKTIQSKNNLSGIQFSWKNHNSFSVNNRYLKRLFYKLNRTAKGNIGWASRCWIAAVENIDENISNWVLSDFTSNEKDKWLDNTINYVSEMIISLINSKNGFCGKNL